MPLFVFLSCFKRKTEFLSYIKVNDNVNANVYDNFIIYLLLIMLIKSLIIIYDLCDYYYTDVLCVQTHTMTQKLASYMTTKC